MKYLILTIWFCLFFSPQLVFAKTKVFKCKVDGVVTFQNLPCKELLQGKQQRKNAKVIEVDPNVVGVSESIKKKAKMQKWQWKYGQTHRSKERKSIDESEAIAETDRDYEHERCTNAKRSYEQLKQRQRKGYHHSQSRNIQNTRRSLEQTIDTFCK